MGGKPEEWCGASSWRTSSLLDSTILDSTAELGFARGGDAALCLTMLALGDAAHDGSAFDGIAVAVIVQEGAGLDSPAPFRESRGDGGFLRFALWARRRVGARTGMITVCVYCIVGKVYFPTFS